MKRGILAKQAMALALCLFLAMLAGCESSAPQGQPDVEIEEGEAPPIEVGDARDYDPLAIPPLHGEAAPDEPPVEVIWDLPLTAEEIAERLRTTTALPPDGLPGQIIFAHYWPAAYIDWSSPITDAADIAQIIELLRDLRPVRMDVPLLGGPLPTITLVYSEHTKEYSIAWSVLHVTGPDRALIFHHGGHEYSVDIRIWDILDRYDMGAFR